MASKGKSQDKDKPEKSHPPQDPVKRDGPLSGNNSISSEIDPTVTSQAKRKMDKDRG
jgi:hypothetical protein